MSLVAGAVSFSEGMSPDRIAGELARRTARFEGLQPRLLHRSDAICCYSVERPADRPTAIQWQSSPERRVFVCGDVNYAGSKTLAAVSADNAGKGLDALRIPGRWVALEVPEQGGRLRLVTDRLGSCWVFLAQVPGGMIFSSDFGAVAEQLRGNLGIDDPAALCLLITGLVPGDGTVFREISVVPHLTAVELRPEGAYKLTRQVFRYGDRYRGATLAEKFARLDEIFEDMGQRIAMDEGGTYVLSLSGGWDSRYLLCLLDRHAVPADCCTFGDPGSHEVRTARRKAAIAGRQSRHYDFKSGDWGQWRRSVHQLGTTYPQQWAGWSEDWCGFLSRYGRSVLTGFGGETIAGKSLHYQPDADDWMSRWTDVWMKHFELEADDPRNFIRPVGWRLSREAFREGLSQELQNAEVSAPYQRNFHLRLYGGHRRNIACQINLMARHVTPVIPLCDDAMLRFFTNLDYEDLNGQSLYIAYGKARFPRFFPKHEKLPPSLARRVVWKTESLARQVFGPRPSGQGVVDHRRTLMPNRARIIDLARRVQPLVDELFDIDRFCAGVAAMGQPAGLPYRVVIGTTGLFFLLSLCEGSREAPREAPREDPRKLARGKPGEGH